MLKPKQVDISMLFPEPIVAEGLPTTPAPVFLSGEKRQAVRTSTPVPPVKTVERVNKEVNQVRLQDYLYVISHLSSTMELTPSRSKYSIELSQDLDDSAVSLLIENGLGSRFPTPCDAWKAQNTKSKEATRKTIFEKKQDINKKLKNDQSLLADTLAREITGRIQNELPYVLPFDSCLSNKILMLQ